MCRFILIIGLVLGCIGFVGASSAFAIPFSIMIGDNDGFGFGDANVPDNADLLNDNFPDDRRSAAEAAASDGAQQTDFYSALLNPLPTEFDVVFTLPIDISSATFEIDMGGFQATTFAQQILVSFNGVAQPNLLDFEDGILPTRVRQFNLDISSIANANAAGEFRVTFDRGPVNNNTIDVLAFDYFKLSGIDVAVDDNTVPEPVTATLGLMGLGVMGLAMRRRVT